MIITNILKFSQKCINNTFLCTLYITEKIDAVIKCSVGAISCYYCCCNDDVLNDYYYNQVDIIFGNENILKNEKIKYDTIDNLNDKINEINHDIHDREPEKKSFFNIIEYF